MPSTASKKTRIYTVPREKTNSPSSAPSYCTTNPLLHIETLKLICNRPRIVKRRAAYAASSLPFRSSAHSSHNLSTWTDVSWRTWLLSRIALSAALYDSHMATIDAHGIMLLARRLCSRVGTVAGIGAAGQCVAGVGASIAVYVSCSKSSGPNCNASLRSISARAAVDDSSAGVTLLTAFACMQDHGIV